MVDREPVPSFDLYAELGVSPNASTAKIDAAWRALVKRHHPDALSDRGADPAAALRIRRLNVAHDWLSDPERRARYDSERALRRQAPPRAARRPEPTAPTERRAPPPAWQPPPPGWSRGEVRWTRREPPPPAPSQPLRLSPIALGSLAVIVGVVVIGGALTVLGFAGDPPGAPDGPGSQGAASPVAGTAATLSGEELAATIPGQVDGLVLVGESGSGIELFGDDAGVGQLATRAGGDAAGVSVAYKSAVTPTGGTTLTVVGLAVDSVSGSTLATEFREMTEEDPDSEVSWSDTTALGRPVAFSHDADDPEIGAYLVSSDAAMYLVITDDPVLAEATIAELP